MIKPDRYLNPSWSVLNISAYLVEQLNSKYDISYDNLLDKLTDDLGQETRENFPYALSFLFLFDKVKYIEERDSFILNENK